MFFGGLDWSLAATLSIGLSNPERMYRKVLGFGLNCFREDFQPPDLQLIPIAGVLLCESWVLLLRRFCKQAERSMFSTQPSLV